VVLDAWLSRASAAAGAGWRITRRERCECGVCHGQVSVAVSLISVAILALSVAVGLATYRRARPRLVVSVWKEVIVGVGSRTRIFSKVVDNVGHGGITMHDVGVHADGVNGQCVSVCRLREAGIAVQGPDLPHTTP
jgi:hypothetical protein